MVSHDVTNLTISQQFLNRFCVLNFASVNNDLLVTNLVTFMKKGLLKVPFPYFLYELVAKTEGASPPKKNTGEQQGINLRPFAP